MPLWTTPDTEPTDFNQWVFRIPENPQWIRIFWGALSLLSDAMEYQEGEDGLTPLEVSSFWAQVVYEGYIDNMIGSIRWGAWGTLPDNLLPCDGSLYLKDDYPKLYDILDAQYIVDATSFRTPDIKQRVPLTAGSGSLTTRSLGQTGGVETVQLSVNEMPSHNHGTQIYSSNIDVEGAGVPDPTAVGLPPIPTSTGDTGGNQPHENMPPFYVLKAGIVSK